VNVKRLAEIAVDVRMRLLTAGESERLATGAEALVVQLVPLLLVQRSGRRNLIRPWIGKQSELADETCRGVWHLRRCLRVLGEHDLVVVQPLGPQGCSIRMGERLEKWVGA
jgi:hypothetical protein